MSAVIPDVPPTVEAVGLAVRAPRRQVTDATEPQWRYTALVAVICLVALIPVLVTVVLSVRPQIQSNSTSPVTLQNFQHVFAQTDVLTWLRNSLAVTGATVLASVCVAAPAGYVVSRGRNWAISTYGLLLFVAQAFPVIVSIVPLFALFAKADLNDSRLGVSIVYASGTIAVATWMMAAYFDTIPVALEEASWIDGCSLFGGFVRIVLRNSLPGLLSTAIFAFLLAWGDFLIAAVFLRSGTNFTLPVGLQTFFAANNTQWGYVMAVSVIVMAPPVVVFGVLHRYFSIGGLGGSLAGR